MEVVKIIGIALAALLLLALVIGGIVFWRGWLYAATHKNEIALKRIEFHRMLAENQKLLNDIAAMEKDMDSNNIKQEKND